MSFAREGLDVGVSWTEELNGRLSFDQTDFNQAMLDGRRCRLRLTLAINDIGQFLESPIRRAKVTQGFLNFGERMDVKWGEFELLSPASELFDHLHRRMRYRLNLRNDMGEDFRLRGFKLIENDPGYDSWSDTTTLFVRLYSGWWPTTDAEKAPSRRDWQEEASEALPEFDDELEATGILFMSPGGFAREVRSFFRQTGDARLAGIAGSKRFARSRLHGIADTVRFGTSFAEGVAKAYVGAPIPDGRPSFPVDCPRPPWDGERKRSKWHVVPGREVASERRYALKREVVPFAVKDLAFPLNLHHLKADGVEATEGPVLLIPGSGVRAELFYGQPVGETIVDFLLREKYDVWVENWRASIDLPTTSYTLDEAARLDHRAAVQTVLEKAGADSLGVVAHCQGSVSLLMAAVAGFLPEGKVRTVVSSGISLFFEVPERTWLKQRALLPLFNMIGSGADAQWGIRPQTPAGAGLTKISRSCLEYPCGNAPCQISNFMYGSGWDVLLRHKNLNDSVHAWTARELGYTPFSLIRQVSESCRYGHIVPAKNPHPKTPPSYVASKPKSGATRFTFIGGDHNWMFEAEGQQKTCEFFRSYELPADFVVLPGYGHLDTWWGVGAPADVFPIVRDGLRWDGKDPAPSSKEGRQTSIQRPRRLGLLRRNRNDQLFPFSKPPLARSR
jgi:hypothetical protein